MQSDKPWIQLGLAGPDAHREWLIFRMLGINISYLEVLRMYRGNKLNHLAILSIVGNKPLMCTLKVEITSLSHNLNYTHAGE